MSALSTPNTAPEQSIPHLQTSPVHVKSILMAVDYSDQSIWAAKYAAGLAKQLQSRLSLLHVVPEEVYMVRPTVLAADLAKFEIERGRNELKEFTVKIPEVRTLQHEEIVLCGPAAEMIDRAAETQKADLLVLGSHGRSGVSKLALGSVAEMVIRHQHRPVLVVGPHCKSRYSPLKSVILAVDLPVTSLRAVQYATSITRQSGASLTVVHVIPIKPGEASEGAVTERDVDRELQMLVPHDPEHAIHVSFKVLQGDAAAEILHATETHNARLIVLGAKEQAVMADHAPWNTVSQVIRGADCPVLVVPPHFA